MAKHSLVAITLWICTLASMPFSASAINACSQTEYFSVATNPTYYQCCAGLPTEVKALTLVLSGLPKEVPEVLDPFSGANPEALRESSYSKVTINEKSPYIVLKDALSMSCVNVAKVSQTERILRQSTSWGCREVVGYDRVFCYCTVDCSGQRTSNCPGVLPGDCPVVNNGPQDSNTLQWQPWLLATTYSACSAKTNCGGTEPGPAPTH
jgi:hypothetical protein